MLTLLTTLTTLRRAAIVAGLCTVIGLYFPLGAIAADDAAPTDGGASAAQVNPPAASAPEMAGCAGPNGACCGSCQEKAAENKPADQAAGGCPCQRAKQSHKGS